MKTVPAMPAEVRRSPLLVQLAGIRHGFSTRIGGVSSGVFSSLNLGKTRGDEPDNVLENLRILADSIGFDPLCVATTAQVHGDTIRTVTAGGLYFDPVPCSCDALITNVPGVALLVFSADCVPILLADPVRRAVGAVHAGWRGTALGIVRKTVERMALEYGTAPEDLICAIGPAIGHCCFEADEPVFQAMSGAIPGTETNTHRVGSKYFIDLKAQNGLSLIQAGVKADRITIDAACTKCNPELFWSHRRDGDSRGLQSAVIALKE